jgi:hypothetical protein
MATTTKAATKTPAVKGTQKSAADYVQQAIQDIDHARERAGVELRESLDSAVERLREAAGDLRKRAEQQAAEFEHAFEEATEDGRRELGRRAIMAQRSPEALKEMSSFIRKRKAELTEQAGTGAGSGSQ